MQKQSALKPRHNFSLTFTALLFPHSKKKRFDRYWLWLIYCLKLSATKSWKNSTDRNLISALQVEYVQYRLLDDSRLFSWQVLARCPSALDTIISKQHFFVNLLKNSDSALLLYQIQMIISRTFLLHMSYQERGTTRQMSPRILKC